MSSIPYYISESQDLPITENFVEYLPPKPYCTNELGYLLIRPKAVALTNAYIQMNPVTRAYWLVFDLDRPDSPRFWYDESAVPTPNISVINRENGHEHLYYLIDPAVYTLRQARRKPLELAADVDKGLTALLGADPAYGKLIAKNPLHKRWLAFVWHQKAWGLTELIEWIPRKIQQQKPPVRETIGLGRNCTVFEKIRTFAYSEWRRQKFDKARYQALFDAVFQVALDINSGFVSPMQPQEVKSIARSVSKWTSRHLTQENWTAWGDVRRQKSIVVRHTKSEERASEAKALYAGGKTQAQIAVILGINQSQVSRLLKS